jgi:ELWxxDGT repeat protein
VRRSLDGRSTALASTALLALGLAAAPALAQEPAFLVADIDLHGVAQHSRPDFFAVFGGWLYFSAEGDDSGRELWRSDGIAAERVADLLPGPEGSDPWFLVESGGLLYFSASDPDAGRELWRSDGTAAGTWRVADIAPGPDSSSPGGIPAVNKPPDIAAVSGRVVFTAAHPDTGREFWGSDGTAAGTVLLGDIWPGVAGGSRRTLTELGGAVFLSARDDVGAALWKSDGTVAGTQRVYDVSVDVNAWSPMVNAGGAAFFAGSDAVVGAELWKSDGTPEGTVVVRDIQPGSPGSHPTELTNVGGTLFFVADDPVAGRELWRSDGTEAGTVLVADIRPGDAGSSPKLLADAAGTLFFVANDGSGTAVWTSDGTAAGTLPVATLPAGVDFFSYSASAGLGGLFLFEAKETDRGLVLWRSDGTAAGTFRIVGPNGDVRRPRSFTPFGGELAFQANDTVVGVELWTSDGTDAGTLPVNVRPDPGTGASSEPRDFVRRGTEVFFTADDGLHGEELWVSDGTPGGTRLVVDLDPAFDGSLAFAGLDVGLDLLLRPERTVFGGSVFFKARTPDEGLELWSTEGTEAGTTVLDLDPMPPSDFWYTGDFTGHGNPVDPTEVNGTLFFYGYDPVAGYELWKSDGTAAGTELVKDVNPGPGGSLWELFDDYLPPSLTNLNGTLLFAPLLGRLWKSDGTEAGTVPIRDDLLLVQDFAVAGGTAFFIASDGVHGVELWRTDGTMAGTALVKDIHPTGSAARLASPFVQATMGLTAVGDALFFHADDGVHGRELWTTDGTEAGTRMVKDIVPGPDGSDPDHLASAAGRLVFTAETPAAGREVWGSDGSEAGTRLLADIGPGAASSNPALLTAVRGRLFFTAEGPSGHELWRSDGTPEGTLRVAGGGLDPFTLPPPDTQALGTQGDLLFFNAVDERGQELWAIPIPDCDDGIDNDGDTRIDFPEDPGCFGREQPFEDPACDDGIDNGDGDLLVDFPDDPGCFAAWDGSEADPPFCGLGFELALLLPPWMRLRRRLLRSPRPRRPDGAHSRARRRSSTRDRLDA